jgi:hypothetical protein
METQIEIYAVCSSKKSEQVVKFIKLSIDELSRYCSKRYAKSIISCYENGGLWGLYFTETGKLRATFI